MLGLQFWILRSGVGTEASSPAFFLWHIQRLHFGIPGSVPATEFPCCIRQSTSPCLGPSPPRDLFRGTATLQTLDGPRHDFWVSKEGGCGSRKHWEMNFSAIIFHVVIWKIWPTQGKVLPWRDDNWVVMHGHVLVLVYRGVIKFCYVLPSCSQLQGKR